ncbi:uncharacterized protein CIMG_02267 [Coccidioides immitis RS]|uniref:Uncharacterized protein n=2 Tax=Coccidioides immitis TaxID=5501 RepID=J3KL00_COCIM|nr:uncharacterized protein CIMG_02267 [Coccidioides immitis RS]EAS36913.3 hypothetical protein CIMG_02267 [Coccidioides immitis RS]KMP09823.1 hypothetical protein CIRG_09056 [Coccidioides immitis RMSCC 2394]
MATNMAPRNCAVSALQFRNRTIAGLRAARGFSSTSTRYNEPGDESPRRPSNATFDQTARRQNTKSLLREVFTKSSSPASDRPLFRSFKPQSPSGPVDARNLGANSPHSGRAEGAVRLAPLSFRNLPRGGRPRGGGRNPNQSLLMAANAMSRRQRGRPGLRPKVARRRRNASWQAESEDVDESVKLYDKEKEEKARRKPERYDPDPYNVDKLKSTWPTLPMCEGGSIVANAGSVMEKLNWMGERYVGSFEPPQELAKRMYEGKRVLFKSEEEKAEVLELVQNMVTEKAERLTERKGQVVEPEDASFEVASDSERKGLVGTLVQGKYDKPLVDRQSVGNSPVVQNVLRNLTNNGTYQSAQAEKFLEKFMKGLPARLRNPQPKNA